MRQLVLIFLLGMPSLLLAQQDSTTLPFAIAPNKRLSDYDHARKKEGYYVTAFPGVSVIPVVGFLYGARVFLYNNSTRSDPFFRYEPYKTRYELLATNTTSGAWELRLGVDVPYFLRTPWRLRLNLILDDNPVTTYFGLGPGTLNGFTVRENNQPAAALQENVHYIDYDRTLQYIRPGTGSEPAQVADNLYNFYRLFDQIISLQAERTFWQGRLRLALGAELGYKYVTLHDGRSVEGVLPTTGQVVDVPNGRTKLAQDRDAGLAQGVHSGRYNLVKLGLVYDTRDYEPDPNRGIFLELVSRTALPALAAQYSFTKLFGQAKGFVSIVPSGRHRLVLAGRVALGHVLGDDAPFFEMQNYITTEQRIWALGGQRSLRGYRPSRFAGRSMLLTNFEARWRLFELTLLKQHFAVSLVPNYDLGTVGDGIADLRLGQLKSSYGAGFRFAWNQATVFIMDYARSGEDQLLWLNFNHAF